jgi:hypothetical protein
LYPILREISLSTQPYFISKRCVHFNAVLPSASSSTRTKYSDGLFRDDLECEKNSATYINIYKNTEEQPNSSFAAVMSCGLAGRHKRFVGTYCLHHRRSEAGSGFKLLTVVKNVIIIEADISFFKFVMKITSLANDLSKLMGKKCF